MLYARRNVYISKEEYLKMLNTNNLTEAIRAIVNKDFAPSTLRKLEELRIGLNSLMRDLDIYHASTLHQLVETCKTHREFAEAIEGILETLGAVVAFLSHERGLKPIGYLPTFANVLVEFAATRKTYPNKYVDLLSKAYFSRKALRGEDILRIYDYILRVIKRTEKYGVFIASGLLYDFTLLRLCSIIGFRDYTWRPLLVSLEEMSSACKSLEAGLSQTIEFLKRARPILSYACSMGMDIARFTYGYELLDLLAVSASSHYSAFSLHVMEPEVFLKNYLLIMRQSFLIRLVLSSIHLGDPSVKNELRAFIERWVYP
ncbi:MAG: hypothetical protein QXK88_02645 [Desulfurococcaceae archaeon]